MINEIKEVVKNYLNNAKLSEFTTGTVAENGIMISDKLVIPYELVCGNLKTSVVSGDKVRLLRNNGGKQFYILEVINT